MPFLQGPAMLLPQEMWHVTVASAGPGKDAGKSPASLCCQGATAPARVYVLSASVAYSCHLLQLKESMSFLPKGHLTQKCPVGHVLWPHPHTPVVLIEGWRLCQHLEAANASTIASGSPQRGQSQCPSVAVVLGDQVGGSGMRPPSPTVTPRALCCRMEELGPGGW